MSELINRKLGQIITLAEELKEMQCPNTSRTCDTIFDCFTSEAGFTVYSSDRQNVIAPPYDCNTEYAFRLPWVKCDGTRLDGDGLFLSRYAAITFDGQDNSGPVPYNWYLWTPPSNNPNPTYEWGSLTDFNNGDGVCSVTLQVDCDAAGLIAKQYAIPTTPTSPVTSALWEAMTNNAHTFASSAATSLSSIVTEDDTNWIRIVHPAGVVNGVAENCLLPLKDGGDSYTISQCVKFADDFTHGGTLTSTNSGKIGFGLAGGRSTIDGNLGTGGDTSGTAWSVRPAFDVIGGILQFTAYSYHQNRPGMPPATPGGLVFGENIATGVEIIPGQKYTVALKVIHNTPGVADGGLIMTIDGVDVINRNDLLWMNGTPYTDLVTMSSNHGGDDSFAPPVDTHVQYTDIVATCETA